MNGSLLSSPDQHWISTHVWPPCCNMLHVVGLSLKLVKFFGQHFRCFMMLYSFGNIHATLLRLSMRASLIFYFKAQRALSVISQPFYCNRVAKGVPDVVSNNVVICMCCVEMLRAFGQHLHNIIQKCCDLLRWNVGSVWPGQRRKFLTCLSLLLVFTVALRENKTKTIGLNSQKFGIL